MTYLSMTPSIRQSLSNIYIPKDTFHHPIKSMAQFKTYFITLLVMFMAFGYAPEASARKQCKRDTWFKEMLQLKHDYLVKELNLSREQQTKFFPLYDQMENEKKKLFDQTRAMEKSVAEKGDKATDLELEKASDAIVEMKGRESAIEKKYYCRFKQILTPRQIFKLHDAERKFQRQMVKEHHKKKNQKNNQK